MIRAVLLLMAFLLPAFGHAQGGQQLAAPAVSNGAGPIPASEGEQIAAANTAVNTHNNPLAKSYSDEGSALFKRGEYEKALDCFLKAIEYDGSAPILFYNAGRAAELGNNPAKAASYYRKYLELAPDAEDKSEVEGWVTRLDTIVAQRMVAGPAAPVPALNEPEQPTPQVVQETIPENAGLGWPFWTATGTTAVGIAATGYFLNGMRVESEAGKRNPAEFTHGLMWDKYATGAWIAGGITVAAAGAAVGFYILSDDGQSVAASPAPGGFSIVGSF